MSEDPIGTFYDIKTRRRYVPYSVWYAAALSAAIGAFVAAGVPLWAIFVAEN